METQMANPANEKVALSRIGKMPITIPNGVTVTPEGNTLTIKGPKGELKQVLFPDIELRIDSQQMNLVPRNQTEETKARHGLLRSLIQNMVTGVSEGFKKELEIQGVGFRVSLAGKALKFHLGFSHEITFQIPEGIEVNVEGLKMMVTGYDKYLVGQTAAKIRALKKPEPYKGKGIRYVDEYVIRKAGKAAA